MKIYLASSWRNIHYPAVLKALRKEGYDVYDFRNPEAHFQWRQIDPNWEQWTTEQWTHHILSHPAAIRGFESDMTGLREADVCVLLLPCGRSAHLEAGWAQGAGKKLLIFVPQSIEPELMYGMAHLVTGNFSGILAAMKELAHGTS